ncbi:MAG: SIS domain-containing protein [Bryobacteraceae bacterium]
MKFERSLVEGEYLRDILSQPRAIADTVEGLRSSPEVGSAEGFRRIVLTGMGGSLHALVPLHIRLVERGFPAMVLETAELLHYFPSVLTPETLLIPVSQSGRSAEIVRLLDRAAGARTIGVTNTPGSPLAERTDATVMMRAGTESSVSCKTFLATLVALEWLAAMLCRDDRRRTEDILQSAAAAAEHYLAGWENKVAELTDILRGVRDLFVVGRGNSMATAGTGGLILKESTHFHAEGMSSPAFRHGPFEMSGPQTVVLVCTGDARTAALNENLVRDVRAAGGLAYLIGANSDVEAFRIAQVDGAIRPVLEMLPVQMVSLALGALAGREPGKFELLTKVTTVE